MSHKYLLLTFVWIVLELFDFSIMILLETYPVQQAQKFNSNVYSIVNLTAVNSGM